MWIIAPHGGRVEVALRLGFGGAAGDPQGRAVYVLGGLPLRNVLSDAIDNVGVGADVIRGYPVAAIREE